MLFNSYVFILGFLPVTLLGFYLAGRFFGNRAALAWLALASMVFYAWWNWTYLFLLLASILVNFMIGQRLRQRTASGAAELAAGIALNLLVLGYFKYTNFFLDSAGTLLGRTWHFDDIVLPLAISFFTFQQITYLVDSRHQRVTDNSLLRYAVFVLFFPQLIAGPIVHHGEMLRQYAGRRLSRIRASDIAIGLTIFAIGLFKKVVIADGIAPYSTSVFDAAEAGATLTVLEGWRGALAYTFQLYFDFSGYSDMAIGLARLFGIRLPQNFASPYKAGSIIDFWRRWHMTLSRFLKYYLYVPLGGNRRGPARTYVNLFLVMAIGGLWHGAGWTFVLWGCLHGVYLMVNHGYRELCATFGLPSASGKAGTAARTAGWALTFFCVVCAWVLFRAETLDGALAMYGAMFGANGFLLPATYAHYLGPLAPFVSALGIEFRAVDRGVLDNFEGVWDVARLSLLLAMVVLLPNTQQFMLRARPVLGPVQRHQGTARFLLWWPRIGWALGIAVIAGVSISALSQVSEFLYFQF